MMAAVSGAQGIGFVVGPGKHCGMCVTEVVGGVLWHVNVSVRS